MKVRDSIPQVKQGNTGKLTTADEKGLRVYLASPFFDDAQIKKVEMLEEALELNPSITEVFSPMHNQLDDLEFGSYEWRQAIFANDVKHIDWADIVVSVHDYFDDKTDSGTAWEMGYAYGKGKQVYMLQMKRYTPVNLMLSESIVAYFNNVEDIANYDFKNPVPILFNGESF